MDLLKTKIWLCYPYSRPFKIAPHWPHNKAQTASLAPQFTCLHSSPSLTLGAPANWTSPQIPHSQESLSPGFRAHCSSTWNIFFISIPLRHNFLWYIPCFSFAAAAKSLQSCPTLCWTPGSPSLGFSRQEHWSGLPFPSPKRESEKWKWKVKVKSLSHVRPSVIPWTVAFQAPPSMGFSRQEYWSEVPLPCPTSPLGSSITPRVLHSNTFHTPFSFPIQFFTNLTRCAWVIVRFQ